MFRRTAVWWRAGDTAALPRRSQLPQCGFRSETALDSLEAHIREARCSSKPHHVALYNYPSASGCFAALFAHLYHSRLGIPLLALPFSSVEPFRVEDFRPEGISTCYLLDFIGPKSFAVELSRFIPRVIAFDHRRVTAARISTLGELSKNLELNVDTNKCSARAVHDYFSKLLLLSNTSAEETVHLLNSEDEDRITTFLWYLEDVDLQKWELPGSKAFSIGLRDESSKFNCVTNPYLFEQLMEISANNMIENGNSRINYRQDAANLLLDKAFKIRLGRGTYGECLAVRSDRYSEMSHEIAVELSKRSAASGLRAIGAAVFMQRGNLKMCLRSTVKDTDTSEIAKAYGGGGKPASSSFIIRMDEYNEWTRLDSS